MQGCNADMGVSDMTIDEGAANGAKTLVIGVANRGGIIPTSWIDILSAALDAGLDIAAGLHNKLNDIPALKEKADKLGRTLFDVRHPTHTPPIADGKKRSGKRLLAVVSDFLAGAVEELSPANDADHWDIIEGQGSVYHPSFFGVTVGLIHGTQADALILCHEPTRTHMRGLPHYPLPTIDETMKTVLNLAVRTNPEARFVGICVNTKALSDNEAKDYLAKLEDQYGLLAVDPVRTGVGRIVDRLS